MAIKSDVPSGIVFTDTDFSFLFTIYQSDNTTAQNITGWAISFVIAATKGGTAVFTKTVGSGITITNGSSGQATVVVTDTDLNLSEAIYFGSLKRTDEGSEGVLWTGSIPIEKATP